MGPYKNGLTGHLLDPELKKGKAEHLHSTMHGTNQLKLKALRHGSHSFQPAENTMPVFTS